MPPRKSLVRKPAGRQQVRRTTSSIGGKGRDSGLTHRLTDLTEQIDIIVPEAMARIAALEHLLLEKQVCTREELVRAREFVRIQED